MIKNFFPTYSVLEKSAHHLSVAISVELPMCMRKGATLSILVFEIQRCYRKMKKISFFGLCAICVR